MNNFKQQHLDRLPFNQHLLFYAIFVVCILFSFFFSSLHFACHTTCFFLFFLSSQIIVKKQNNIIDYNVRSSRGTNWKKLKKRVNAAMHFLLRYAVFAQFVVFCVFSPLHILFCCSFCILCFFCMNNKIVRVPYKFICLQIFVALAFRLKSSILILIANWGLALALH